MRVMRLFPPLGPISRMAVGVASLVVMLLLVLDFAFGLVPNAAQQERAQRQLVSELLAVQATQAAARGDSVALQQLLGEALVRHSGLLSVALRPLDGEPLAQAGDHPRWWGSAQGAAAAATATRSTSTQVRVPIRAQGLPWGHLELAFKPVEAETFPAALFTRQSLWPVVVFVVLLVLLRLYLGRLLHQLDPSSRVPERVHQAYDALSEGVLLIDRETRVVLANAAFTALAGGVPAQAGALVSSLPLFAQGDPFEGAQPPWLAALRDGSVSQGQRLRVQRAGSAGNPTQTLVITCTPLLDESGRPRGCLIVLLDRTSVERANDELQTTLAGLKAAHQHIQSQNEDLTRLATRDPLTGSLNRRAFFDMANALQRRLAHQRRPWAAVMVDIDYFKRINDSHGHGVGDQVIQSLAETLAQAVRAQDLVCRFGGEEFCVLLADSDQTLAHEVAERLRKLVQDRVGPGITAVPGMRVTASFGVAVGLAGQHSVEQLLESADQLLYQSKEAGRNRVSLQVLGGQKATEPAVETV
jgi:diguanylate cyclase (GGDEF)-like protein